MSEHRVPEKQPSVTVQEGDHGSPYRRDRPRLHATNRRHGVLSDTHGSLKLPVAWPFADYGGFASGGISFGNMNVEVLESNQLTPSFTAGPAARIRGVALRPKRHLDSAYFDELDPRGIAYNQPTAGPAWTNVARGRRDRSRRLAARHRARHPRHPIGGRVTVGLQLAVHDVAAAATVLGSTDRRGLQISIVGTDS